MLENLPPWLTTAITSVIVAVLTFLLSRRMYSATVTEKEASALSTMTKVSSDLANQLKSLTDDIPNWRRAVATETARAEDAVKNNKHWPIIYEQAKIIIEELSHLHYIKDPGEQITNVEKRFTNIRNAAKKIADCIEG